MKKYALFALSFIALANTNAQTLDEAIKKTDNERYEEAAKVFRALIASDATNATNYFYFGENYYKSDDLDSAIIIWKKGNGIDASNPLSMIGMGKSLWLKGDTTAGKKFFEQAITATKSKNAEVYRQIGATLTQAEKNSLNCAEQYLRLAVKLDPKNIDGLLLLGDALLELNPTNASAAMKCYNDALAIEKRAKIVVRKAKIYSRAQNPELADDLYNEAQALEPNYAPAYREHAELAFRFNQSKKAIEKWQKYLELNDNNYARYRYASALFTGKKYCEAVNEFESIHKNGFKNLYSARLLAYSIYECNVANNVTDTLVYTAALKSFNDYFNIVPKDQIIGLDYKYLGLIQKKVGQKDAYVQSLEKAAQIDKTIASEIYSDLANEFITNKNYDQAIKFFNAKIASDSTKMSAADYYNLGRAYYFGPKDYVNADKANLKVVTLVPDYSMGYFWRARANVQLDLKKETWAAYAHYDKFLSLLKEEEIAGQYKSYAIEALKYLGDYYVNSPAKDLVKAKEVWTKVSTLDPNDKQAKAFLGAK